MGNGHERPSILNIEGQLIALGPVRRDLVPTYQRWVNDFGTARTLGLPPGPMSEDAETDWFERVARQGSSDVSFTIYDRESWRPVGITGLHQIDFRNRTASFGLLIGEPDARGRGFGTEATRLMLDYGFVALGLNNVMLSVYEFNLAARRAYEKAGYREIGRRRQARWMGGRLWDEVLMDCLATEFESPVLARVFVPDESRQ